MSAPTIGHDPRERGRGKISGTQLDQYVDALPDILCDAYERARGDWGGNTVDMVRAAYAVTEVLRQMWLRLATAFPDGHFGDIAPERYIEDYLEQRYSWQRAMAEPFGPGTGGTIAGVLVARGVLRDLEDGVVDMRNALKGLGEATESRDGWLRRWESGKKKRFPEERLASDPGANGGARRVLDEVARLQALAPSIEVFDLVAFDQPVRVLARQLENTMGGPTAYALSRQYRDGTEEVFDKIDGHHLSFFGEDLDGDGIPEIIVQYFCGAHSVASHVYRLRDAGAKPALIPGAVIGSSAPSIRWVRREDGHGFTILAKQRNWAGDPLRESVIERYVFEHGNCVKLPGRELEL